MKREPAASARARHIHGQERGKAREEGSEREEDFRTREPEKSSSTTAELSLTMATEDSPGVCDERKRKSDRATVSPLTV